MTTTVNPLQLEVTPEQVFHTLKNRRGCVWLDSSRPDERFGRYSFLTAEPFLVFSSRGDRWNVERTEGVPERGAGDPFTKLAGLVAQYTSDQRTDAPFPVGGAFGYFSYDLKNQIERLPQRAHDDIGTPDCWFGFYDWLIVFDHVAERSFVIRNSLIGDSSNQQLLQCLQESRVTSPESPITSHQSPIESNFTRSDYLRAVARAKDYITAGDTYQVNLSQRFHTQTNRTAAELYLSLRETNPAPFAAYLDIGEAQILSSSPERFLRLSGRHVQTRPIKGTRPRTGNEATDQVAARELMMSAKDQAELVMITDLERNDLGRVCEFGSVHVPELVSLEAYATVFHLVSTVQGRLCDHLSHVEALRACFPGGSITGAPKIRAMEIIDELEPHARGVYTGAIGYFGFNGESDFNIAIRTMIQKQNNVYFHAGGGIVADSNPADEYDETLAKARGMMEALGRRGQGSEFSVQRRKASNQVHRHSSTWP
ncbi:MAG: aminodeoxychorismate synthase component I [Verrucomicrobiae bacterium]|nr:aminodeoxychorismate synthase component I [Verrucomicrobiae bacterium]